MMVRMSELGPIAEPEPEPEPVSLPLTGEEIKNKNVAEQVVEGAVHMNMDEVVEIDVDLGGGGEEEEDLKTLDKDEDDTETVGAVELVARDSITRGVAEETLAVGVGTGAGAGGCGCIIG